MTPAARPDVYATLGRSYARRRSAERRPSSSSRAVSTSSSQLAPDDYPRARALQHVPELRARPTSATSSRARAVVAEVLGGPGRGDRPATRASGCTGRSAGSRSSRRSRRRRSTASAGPWRSSRRPRTPCTSRAPTSPAPRRPIAAGDATRSPRPSSTCSTPSDCSAAAGPRRTGGDPPSSRRSCAGRADGEFDDAERLGPRTRCSLALELPNERGQRLVGDRGRRAAAPAIPTADDAFRRAVDLLAEHGTVRQPCRASSASYGRYLRDAGREQRGSRRVRAGGRRRLEPPGRADDRGAPGGIDEVRPGGPRRSSGDRRAAAAARAVLAPALGAARQRRDAARSRRRLHGDDRRRRRARARPRVAAAGRRRSASRPRARPASSTCASSLGARRRPLGVPAALRARPAARRGDAPAARAAAAADGDRRARAAARGRRPADHRVARAREIERRVVRAATPVARRACTARRPRPTSGASRPPSCGELGLGARRGATLVRLCRSLDLEALKGLPTEAVARRLERERGLGPWSAGVVCLEGLGRYERGLARDLGLVKLASRALGAAGRGRRRPTRCSRRTSEWAGLASVYLLAGYDAGLVGLRDADRDSRRRQDRRVAPRRAA